MAGIRLRATRFFGTLLLSLLCVFFFALPLRIARAQDTVVPGELLVGLRAAGGAERSALRQTERLASEIGDVVGTLAQLNVVRVRLRSGVTMAQAAATLRNRPEVRYVEPNRIRRAVIAPDDTYYASKQYGPQKTQANLAWDLWTPQAQAVLAIVDTGVDYTHPDLVSKLLTDFNGVVGHNSVNGTANAQDDHGHGTHCAGIAAANTNNGQGVAGIAGWNPNIPGAQDAIKIMPVKVLAANGSGTDAMVADGILWATDHGASVISMSLGSAGSSTTLSDAVGYAVAHNVTVVAAAGNNGSSTLFYPAAYPDVISVAATDSNDKLPSWSNWGAWVKVAAPGNAIYSTYPGGYATLSGTSMACPHVAGEALLIRAHNPTLTYTQVSNLILSNVDTYTPYLAGRTLATGAGRINVYKALLNAGTGDPTLLAFALQSASVTGGTAAVTGTVYLNGPAPVAGVTVALSVDSSAATAPVSVTVPAGQLTAAFSISTISVAAATTATVTATEGPRSLTTTLTVLPASLTSLSLSPNKVAGGAKVTGKVILNAAAPASGLTLPLSYSSTTGLNAPPDAVAVPAGQTQATFTLNTAPVVANASVVVTATSNGATKTATLTITPTALSSISVSPNSIAGGAPCTGRVTLTGPAPAGGIVVALTSSNTAAVTVPATVTVPANVNTIAFPVTNLPVAINTAVTLSASYDVITKTATLTVRPPDLSALTLTPNSVKGGGTVTGKITLTGAVAVDTTITLTNPNAAATVPPSVIVPAGSNLITFPITTVSPGAVKTYCVITATLGSVAKNVTLTVTP